MRAGDLLFIKSSEEPVVCMIDFLTDVPINSVPVRRPKITQNGTEYEQTEFYRFELETPEEQDIRKIEDIKRRHRLTQAAQKEAGPAVQYDMFAEIDPQAPRN